MSVKENYNKLGKILVKKLRDENYSNYIENINNAKSITREEYYKTPRNPNYDKEFQKIEDERFDFFCSLNDKQKEQLDKLILKMLDEVAFNILREIEEGHIMEDSISLTYNGKNIDEVYNEFLSGTFFGEYFLWIESFSKYGKFQY